MSAHFCSIYLNDLNWRFSVPPVYNNSSFDVYSYTSKGIMYQIMNKISIILMIMVHDI